jgi:CDP-diacylglycerol--glycerol-3-phosphate 3-phosphatidyltransferase
MATSLGEPAPRPSSPPTSPAPIRAREVFWNLPNALTLARLLALPVLLAFPLMTGPSGSRFVAWVFIVAAATDAVDGWLARRGQQVTEIGKLLDPLADKLLVTTALVVLLAVGRIPPWGLVLVVVIVGRELAVTGLRGIATVDGQVMSARGPGKLKALAQNVAIGALLFPEPTLGLPAHQIGLTLLTVATLLTLWSGWMIFADYFRTVTAGDRPPGVDR